MKSAVLVLAAAGLVGSACAAGTPPETHATPAASGVSAVLDMARGRYVRSAVALDPANGIPRATRSDESWISTPVNEWTSGFFPGTLWYLYTHSGSPEVRAQAERWTWPLADIPRGTFSHDLGFQFNSSFVSAYRFTGDERFRAPALAAAVLLAARFHPKVGAIKSWDWMTGERTFPVIADNMMNLELLFWGARQPEGDPLWKDLAIRHAHTTLAHHIRPDGGSYHVVAFDTATGRALERFTHQGYADTSTWARGQSWLVYGFTMAYRETGDTAFLGTARRTADYALARLPADGVPCWDYQAPRCPDSALRDASAAAIMASALLELSTYVPAGDRQRYRTGADRIIATLSSPAYLANDSQSQALLRHAVGNHPAGTEMDVGLAYGDYYFVEALMRSLDLRGESRRRVLPLPVPRTFTARPEYLRESKQRVQTGDERLRPALDKLIQEADSALRVGPFTVTAKQRMPPSGDKRDYVSYGPYWWPDSTRADGLPFIRRDGVVNQETRRDSDVLRFYAMTDAVETLAHAYYFTDKPVYAERAALLLRTWFVDATTRMNPHLRYGQAIPGVVEGRGIGIIDTRNLGRLTDAVALIEDAPAWTAADAAAVRDWFAAYLAWLQTSEHGRDEADEANNHGTWYDVQVMALALFLGDTSTARAVAEQARTKRIASHIDSLGRQPLELARTRSLHYSVENLEGMTRLAEMARAAGVDLWNWEAPNGASIRKAIAFVAPYADAPEQWPHPQITKEAPDLFIPLLLRAGMAVTDTSSVARTHRSMLLYPTSPARACDRECTLVRQVIVSGRRTGWPGGSALSVPKTVEVVSALMAIAAPDARVKTAVHAATAWLREVALYPGPVWAQHYDVRTGAVIGPQRISAAPLRVLAAYDTWVARQRALPVAAPAGGFDAVVDAGYAGREGEIVDGVKTYRRIGPALRAAPVNGERPYVIRIRSGRYHEKLAVEMPNVHFVGESRDSTILTFDATAATPAPSGGAYGTRGSSTLRIAAPGFRLENMTVENGFDYMANYVKPNTDPTKLTGTQGVAVMLDHGSDRAVFENCVIRGHQDTLFPNAGRSYFHKCTISGSVDFIFGAGRAVFDDVDIISRDRGSRTNNGYITAPSTPVSQPHGFLIINSRLCKETPAMAPNTVTLGRPWHPSGDPDAIGSAVFINTWMDEHIGARGWDSMNSTNAAGVRVSHTPADSRFREFGSSGPGAVASPTRNVLSSTQAAGYTIEEVLEGWNPKR